MRKCAVDTLLEREIGTVIVKVESFMDECYDLSYMGELASDWDHDFRKVYVYDRANDAFVVGVTGPDDCPLLQDRRTGKFAQDEHPGRWRNNEYRYVVADKDRSVTRAEAYQCDIKRLLDYGDSWYGVYLRATVELDGVKLGSAYVGGYESDSEDYLQSEARNLAYEALSEARNWMARR